MSVCNETFEVKIAQLFSTDADFLMIGAELAEGEYFHAERGKRRAESDAASAFARRVDVLRRGNDAERNRAEAVMNCVLNKNLNKNR